MQYLSACPRQMREDMLAARRSLFIFENLDVSQIKNGTDWVDACLSAKSCAFSNDGTTVQCTPASGVLSGKYYPAVSGVLGTYSTSSRQNILADDRKDWYWRAVRQCSVCKETSTMYSLGSGSMLGRGPVDASNMNPRYLYIDPSVSTRGAWKYVADTSGPIGSSGGSTSYYASVSTSAYSRNNALSLGGWTFSTSVVAGTEYEAKDSTFSQSAIVHMAPVYAVYKDSASWRAGVWIGYSLRVLAYINSSSPSTPSYQVSKAMCPIYNGVRFTAEVFDIGPDSDLSGPNAITVGQPFSLGITNNQPIELNMSDVAHM